MKTELSFDLVRAPDERLRSQAYQQELREFEKSLRSLGFKVTVTIELIEAAAGPDDITTYLGQFAIELARGPLVGVIATVLVAWLQGKYGRKLRLKVTDTEIEVEAQTEEQVQSLLKQAQEIQQRNRPKVIRES